MDIHQQRVAREHRRGLVSAALLNAAFVFYAGLLALFLRDGSFAQAPAATYAALLGAAALVGGLWTSARTSTGRMIVERTNPVLKAAATARERHWLRSVSGLATCLVGALTLIVAWRVTDTSLRELLSRNGLNGAKRIFLAILSPDWSILPLVIEETLVTIFMALQATLIAVPIAFVMSFPAARNVMRATHIGRLVYVASRLLFNFVRSIEALVWAIIFSVWVGIGPFAGMLALMVHSVASLVKLFSEQVENVEHGPIEAIEATGAGRLQVIWFAIVPQVVLPYLSFTIYRWDINVRMATIIGLVGGGGIGKLLIQYQGLAKWHAVGTIVIVIAVVVWLMDWLSSRLREAIY
ncbi:MAG: phosphonate ABC transporter, permease protein PhnE [Planctomycetota bacterium]